VTGVEVTLPYAHLDLAVRQTAREEFRDGEHPLLAGREPRDQDIGVSGRFSTCEVDK
jgi:hypothetical protein